MKPLIRSAMEDSRKRLAIDAVILKNGSRMVLTGALNAVTMMQFRITSITKEILLQHSHRISVIRNNLKFFIPSLIKQESFRLEILASRNLYNDPQNVLNRGYSITLFMENRLKMPGKLRKAKRLTRFCTGEA